MLTKLFTKLFHPSKRVVEFDPEIVQIGQDVRRAVVQFCRTNLEQVSRDLNAFTDQKPSQWQWGSDKQPEPPVINSFLSSRPRSQNARFTSRPARVASGAQQGRERGNFPQGHQRQVPSTFSRAARRPQTRHSTVQARELPKSHFSTPTPINRTTSLTHSPDQESFHQFPFPECSPGFVRPTAGSGTFISRQYPESDATRTYDLAQAPPSTEIPLILVDHPTREAPEQGLLLQFANVRESPNEQPSLLFKVDEPTSSQAEDETESLVRLTKRAIQATVSLLLGELKLHPTCEGYAKLPKISTGKSEPRLRLASLLLKFREGLKRCSTKNTRVNNLSYLDELQALERDLRNVLLWFDRKSSIMEIDAICASKENDVNYLLSRFERVGLDFPYSEDWRSN